MTGYSNGFDYPESNVFAITGWWRIEPVRLDIEVYSKVNLYHNSLQSVITHQVETSAI
jgi:hypothetical protein